MRMNTIWGGKVHALKGGSIGKRRGGALLAVLWLAAALGAIAFSVANTVRGETERTATAVDGLKSYYLATGAVDRAILYMLWGNAHRNPDGSPRYWAQWMSRLYLPFPTGDVAVEIIPAAAKMNLNTASEEDLFRLLVALGAEPARARVIAAAIVDWRTPPPGGGLTIFDQHYLSLEPSFRARHASFEETEEVLLVQGMTPDLFYGSYVRDPEGRLRRRSGLRDCVSVYGSSGRFDVNSADPALLLSLGIDPAAVQSILERRRRKPFEMMEELEPVRQFGGEGAQRLAIGGLSIYTLRATARLRLPDGGLSDLRRSVAATVKFLGPAFQAPYHVLRWHDNEPADLSQWQ
jgi:general secretion pathway protein K